MSGKGPDVAGGGRVQHVAGTDPETEGEPMPLIEVKALEGVFTTQQRKDIVERLTDAMVEIEGENMRPVTVCVFEEVPSGGWAIGGTAITTDDAKALARGDAPVA
jgi:4-oxalocrotonate tautomerase